MFLVSLLQNLNIPIEFIEDGLNSILSESMVKEVSSYLNSFYRSAARISFLTIIITLWSASQGLHSITNGMNRIYDAYENRNWFYIRVRAMIYTIALFGILLISLIIIVLGRSLNKLLNPILLKLPYSVYIIYNLRYVIIFVFLVIVFALIYRNFPNISKQEHKEYKFKYQLAGAMFCAAAWFVLSVGISIYVDSFNGFSIYGSLTKLAIIMVWLYFCMICLMLGAEINYVFHEQIKNHTLRKNIKRKISNTLKILGK